MTAATSRPSPRHSLQWRIFWYSLGITAALAVVVIAIFSWTLGTAMIMAPTPLVWPSIVLVALIAGFVQYLVFKVALRSLIQRFLGQFYALIEQPPPQLEPYWRSTELDHIDDFITQLINELRGYIARQSELQRLERYFSPEVAQQIASGGDSPDQAARTRVTVLFTDIRGFTTLTETLPADEIVNLLNAYFTAVIDLIYAEKGTVLKLIGDGVLAVFGAPINRPDDVDRAARVARQLPAAFNRVAAVWAAEHGRAAPAGIGVGVASGEVVVGNIGSPRHLDYTVIGDTVNISSRLCGAAKASQVLITADAVPLLHPNGAYQIRPLDAIPVKGKDQPVAIAELVGAD